MDKIWEVRYISADTVEDEVVERFSTEEKAFEHLDNYDLYEVRNYYIAGPFHIK